MSVPADETAPALQVTADVDASAGPATRTNTASVDSPTSDPEPGNNTTTDDVEVGAEADLAVEKTTVGENPVAAGETTSFELAVTNDGPSTASSVSVVDALPEGTSLESADGEGWTCEDSSGLTVTCERDEVEPGAAPVITVEVEVVSSVEAGAVLTNVAAVSAATPDPSPERNEDDSSVSVDAEADLVLEKSGPGSATAGGHVVFDVDVTNEGPSDAVAPVEVEDTLPAELSFVSASGPWDCEAAAATGDGQPLTCVLEGGEAALAADSTAPTLRVRTAVDSAAGTSRLTNMASVESPTVDPEPERARDDHEVNVTRRADLVVEKTHEGPVGVGDEVDFSIQVRNDGPSVATNVQATDPLPDELVAVDAAGEGWSCDVDGQEVTCDLDRSLAPGAQAEAIVVTAEVTAAAYPSVDNTATASSATPEGDGSTASDSDTVDVEPRADLAIEKTYEGDFVVGESGEFTLAVTNLGPTADPGPVSVGDTLADGLEPVFADGPGWDCGLDGAVVTCERPDGLEVDESSEIVLEVDVTPEAAPEVGNEATVSSGTDDPEPGNDRDEVTVPVDTVSSLTATKEAVAEDGDELTWEVTVGNDGPHATTEPIVVVDDLVDELTFVSASGDGWDCEAEGQVVTCAHDESLEVGDDTVLTLVTAVDAPPEAEIANVVRVSGGSTDEEADGVGPDPDAPDPDAPSDDVTARDEVTRGELADTGVEVTWLVAVALVLLGAGAVLVARARRSSPSAG